MQMYRYMFWGGHSL